GRKPADRADHHGRVAAGRARRAGAELSGTGLGYRRRCAGDARSNVAQNPGRSRSAGARRWRCAAALAGGVSRPVLMRARGFTLLEVLVAISIFALIGVASYRVLIGVMQSDERLAVRAVQMRGINRALWIMQQDVEQLVPRNVRTANGAAHINYLLVDNEAELPLQLTRGGRSNPLGLPRSDAQRIAYRVGTHPGVEDTDSEHYQDERIYLLRYSWPMLDGSGDPAQAQVQILLPDVEQMTVSVVTAEGPQLSWPPQGSEQPSSSANGSQPGGEQADEEQPDEEQSGASNESERPLALQLEMTLREGSALQHSFKIW